VQKSFLLFYSILVYALIGQSQLQAQSLPVGTAVLEDAYRRAQLLGQIDSSVSFTSRPIFPSAFSKNKDLFDPDSTLKSNRWTKFNGTLRFAGDFGVIKLLPVTWQQQYNSNHPRGINDGAMIPARGYQTLLSAGVYVKFGPLSIQLRPEMVYAENRTFQGFPGCLPGNTPAYLGGIDLPERFGEKAYNKLFWGQSSVRLTVGPVSMGLSNENLWWGPGMRNSLLMTNNAPGFKHLTLNTVKPFRTPIGSFEGQMIAGRLDRWGYSVSESNDWRYLNGVVLSYQPRWVPGLFIGATRSLMTYGKSLGKNFSDYLPVIIPVSKKAAGGIAEDAKKRDQLASLFARWLLPEAHGEIYFEYGREDHAWDTRDFLQEPSHSGAYILGLRKLVPLKNRKEEYLQINMEVTQLESSYATISRGGAVSWYTHGEVIEGYTNLGQILGAGIGPGSNMQTINISWVKSLKMIGIQFERFVHNNNYHYNVVKDIRSNWVDLSVGLFGDWDYKNLLFNARFEFVREINYEWQYKPKSGTPEVYWNQTEDSFNFHGQLGITWRF
jgi:hypothetical protein